MADTGPKSAFEIAMERLRRKDEEEGVVAQPLSDERKAAIADVRTQFEARLAQLEVMHKSTLQATRDPGARFELEENYRRERDRLVSERDAKIEKLRNSE